MFKNDTGHAVNQILMHLCQREKALSKAVRVRFPLFMEAITGIGYFYFSGITFRSMG